MKKSKVRGRGGASTLGCALLLGVSALTGRAATPLEIDGCVLWLDASDASTITQSGGYVSQWDDKSSSGADVSQGTGDNQPQTGAASQNSKNVLTFDGVDDWLLGNAVLGEGDDDYTFVAVWYPKKAVDGQVIIEQNADYWDHPNTDGSRAALHASGSSYGFAGEWNDAYPASFSANAWRLSTMVLDGTQWDNVYVYDNGNDLVTGAMSKSTQNVFTNGFIVGATLPDKTQNLYGDLAEIIVYDRPITHSEIDALQYYLDQKWGLGLQVEPLPPTQVQYDFEDGTLQGWSKTSGTTTNHQPVWSGRANFAQSGRYFIGTAEDEKAGWDSMLGDNHDGEWVSPSLVLTGNTARALVGGGNFSGSGWECQLLMEYESTPGFWSFARAETGTFRDQMREYVWPIDDLVGENVRFRIVDDNSGDWGHINVDDIRITTEVRDEFHTDFNGSRIISPLFAYRPWINPSVGLTGTGRLRIDTSTDVPGGGDTYDLWSGINHAPQLRLPVNPSNTWFDLDTHIVSRTFSGTNTHTGLLLVFKSPDATSHNPVMFGPYRDEGLWAQSPDGDFGGHIGALSNVVTDVHLRVSRRDDTYSFLYRTGGQGWTTAGSRSLPGKTLLFVGLFAKAWDTTASPITEFDYLSFMGKPEPTLFFVR